MGYPPVVVVDSGGVPRTQVAEGGSAPAATVSDVGRPITLTDNAPPIMLFDGSGDPWTPYSDEAVALFARFTTQPTTARKVLIDNLIVSLKTADVWTKLDALYVMAAADSQAARRNWVQDLYNLTAVSSPTFAADRGYTGDGSSSYLRTSLLTDSPSIKRLQDSNHYAAWMLAGAAGTNRVAIGITETLLRPLEASGTAGGTRNQNASATESFVNASVPGHYVNTRTASTDYNIYKNGALNSNKVVTSGSTIQRETAILARGLNMGVWDSFSNHQIAAASIGGGLTAQNCADLYAALNTYLTAVGAV